MDDLASLEAKHNAKLAEVLMVFADSGELSIYPGDYFE